MKRFLTILTILYLSITMVGCSSEPVGPEVPESGNLALSCNYIEVEPDGGNFSVEIFTEYEYTTICSVDWIHITGGSCSTDSCSLYFSVDENSSESIREGQITILCDDYNLWGTITIVQRGAEPLELVISLDNSRTSIDGNYTTIWSEDDSILCNGMASCSTIISDQTRTAARFIFPKWSAAPYHIIYPAPPADITAQKEGCYPVVFQAKQQYTENSFCDGAAPMYGYSYDKCPTMHHLVGILSFEIYGDATLSNIVLTAEKGYISGIFDLNCETGEQFAQEKSVFNQIELSFGDGLKLSESTSTAVYITIPAGMYGRIEVAISDISGGRMLRFFSSDNNPIEAGTLRIFSALQFTAES